MQIYYMICRYMQIYAIICINPTSMDLKRKYAKICRGPKTNMLHMDQCKICKSMQKYAKHAVYANHVTTGNMQDRKSVV